MRLHSTFSVLPALLSVKDAGAFALPTNSTGAGGIEWGSCNRNLTGLPEVQCGNLTVPLNYLNESDTRTITLNLIKSAAKTQPAPKGSILLNYGGPGQDGINNFLRYFTTQRKYIGEDHDMISWDPRATRSTLPATCINATDPNAQSMNNFLSKWHSASDTSAQSNWAEATVLADVCYAALQESGRFVGMGSTARDVMAIVDALGEDGMLRYWGISGGTTMGSTIVAMFPDRMDRVVLDGVMNVHQYYHDLAETEWFSDTDNVYKTVMNTCAQLGPEKCPIARANCTGADLIARFEKVFDHLRTHPIPVSDPSLPYGSLIEYSSVVDWVYRRLYAPYKFNYLVGVLAAIEERNATKYSALMALDTKDNAQLPSEDTVPAAQFAASAIRCGDRFPRSDKFEDVEAVLDVSNKTSPRFGYYGAQLNAQLCAQWKFTAVERYDGDFNVKTKNPVLLISNKYDPATPIVSARNMSSGFQGSVLLEQEGLGHVSFLAQPSNCTRDAVLAYMADATLPEKDAKCKPNLPVASYVVGKFKGLDHV